VTGRRSIDLTAQGLLSLLMGSPIIRPEEAPRSVLSPVTIGASSFSDPDTELPAVNCDAPSWRNGPDA
jgi:hypothetical protein